MDDTAKLAICGFMATGPETVSSDNLITAPTRWFAFSVPPEVRKTPVHQGVLKITNSKMVPEQGNSLSERQEP